MPKQGSSRTNVSYDVSYVQDTNVPQADTSRLSPVPQPFGIVRTSQLPPAQGMYPSSCTWVVDEGWSSQTQLSSPVEKEEEETLVTSSKALTRFSIGLLL